MWEEIKTPLIMFLSVIAVIYSLLAFGTYKSIHNKAERLTELSVQFEEKKEKGEELTYNEKKEYNTEVALYNRAQGLLQSFWMDAVFNFEDFEEIK